MPTVILLGLSAISLAGVAGFFSIIGLSEFAAASPIPVMIFGAVLETSKLVATGFLHYYWYTAPRKLKYSGVFFIISVMLITMLGIYGFLSASHYNQTVPLEAVEQQTNRIDEQIGHEKELIQRDQIRLKQMDDVVNGLIGNDKINNASSIRDKQKKERDGIEAEVKQSYARINDFENKKLELKQSIAGVSAKLGPVRYAAQFLGIDANYAVNIFIIMLMIPFDPFAVWLVMATTYAYKQYQDRKLNNKKEKLELEDRKERDDLVRANEQLTKQLQDLGDNTPLLDRIQVLTNLVEQQEAEIERHKLTIETIENDKTALVEDQEIVEPIEADGSTALVEENQEQQIEEPHRIIVEDAIAINVGENIQTQTVPEEKKQEEIENNTQKSNIEFIKNIISEVTNINAINAAKITNGIVELPVEENIDNQEPSVVGSEDDFEPDAVTSNIVSIIRRNPEVVDDLKQELLDDVPYPVLKELENVLVALDKSIKKEKPVEADTKSWLGSTTLKPAQTQNLVMGNEHQK